MDGYRVSQQGEGFSILPNYLVSRQMYVLLISMKVVLTSVALYNFMNLELYKTLTSHDYYMRSFRHVRTYCSVRKTVKLEEPRLRYFKTE